MSVRKREWRNKSGRQVRWDVRYYDETSTERKETFLTKKEADTRDADIRLGKARGADIVTPRAGRKTFQRFADEWLETRFRDPATREAVEQRLRVHVYPDLGKIPLGKIKVATIKAWLHDLEGAESSRRLVLIHVVAVLDAAVAENLIANNPAKDRDVERPRVHRGKPWVPKPSQVRGLHEALPDRWDIVVPLGAWLGLRQGEAFGLSPLDIDRENDVLHVRRQVKRLPVSGQRVFAPPKYGKERDVPLFPGTGKALAAYMLRFPARDVTLPWKDPVKGKPRTVPLLVTSASGLSVDGSRFNAEHWHKALTVVGIERVRGKTGMHSLRHYMATSLLASGYSIKDVSEYLGHEDEGFTLRTYTHFVPRVDEATRHRNLTAFHASDGMDTASNEDGEAQTTP